MEFTYLSGQSPIDPDERAGLIPQHITTMGELNGLEAANIAEAIIWLQTVRNPDPLSSEFLRTLHQKMLGQADILVTRVLGRPIFTWGATNLVSAGPFRDKYIAALVSATAQDIKPLLDFVRS